MGSPACNKRLSIWRAYHDFALRKAKGSTNCSRRRSHDNETWLLFFKGKDVLVYECVFVSVGVDNRFSAECWTIVVFWNLYASITVLGTQTSMLTSSVTDSVDTELGIDIKSTSHGGQP